MTRHTSTSRSVWRVVTFVAVLCVSVAYRPALVHGQGGQRGQRGQQGQPSQPGQRAQTSQIPAHPNELIFPTLEYTPPKAADHRHVLSNGVVVFVVEDHTLPLVDVSVLVRTGEYLGPPDKVGLASLTGSQMRAGGTASMTPSEFDEQAAFLAAQNRRLDRRHSRSCQPRLSHQGSGRRAGAALRDAQASSFRPRAAGSRQEPGAAADAASQ